MDKIKKEIECFKNKKRIYYQNFSDGLRNLLEISFPGLSIEEQFYLVSNDLKERKKCEYPDCANFALFNKKTKTYKKGCSKRHSTKIAMIEKYGVENPSQVKEIREKAYETMKEKYGGWGNASTEIKKKHNKAVKKKYGVDNISQSVEIKEKKKKVFKEKYGGIGNASQIIFDKQKQTVKEKYGEENIFSTDYGKNKIKQTNLKKYGVENPQQSEEIKEKTKKTNLKKYGTHYPILSNVVRMKHKKILFDKLIERISGFVIPCFNIQDYKGVNFAQKYEWQCIICDTKFIDNVDNGRFPRCPKCFPRLSGISNLEKELFDSIDHSNKIQSDKSVLNGKELDIYIPDKKLAIEFNGIYWHSELNGREKNYHLNKTKGCEAKGIHLIHIFEHEWIEKKEIVLSMINSRLGKFEKEVNSDQCEVKKLTIEEKDHFLKKNNLKNIDCSDIAFGLIHYDEIISVITFTELENNNYEMNNLCNSIGIKILDEKHKLFSYFKEKFTPKKIITFLDRRYFIGTEYDELGFKKAEYNKPTYWYFGKGISGIEENSKWEKSCLNDKLDKFYPELTEWENMQINGYDRIWDCGQVFLEWTSFI